MNQLQQGLQYFQSGKLAEAEACYRAVLAAEPNNCDAMNLMGVLAYQVGRHDVANQLLSRAVQFNPLSPQYRKNLGANFLALGKLDAAIEEFSALVRMQPKIGECYFNRAQAYKAKANVIEAEADYRKAIELDANHFGAHNNLATLLLDQGRVDEAEALFIKAAGLQPNHPEVLNNLGVIQSCRGQVELAVERFMEAHHLAPNNPRPVVNLADALVTLGRDSDAEICFTRAVAIDSKNDVLWKKYGDLLLRVNRPEQALEAYRRAVALSPKTLDAVLAGGKILFEKRLFSDAVEMLAPAFKLHPDNLDLQSSLAVCMFESGDKEAAMELLQDGLAKDPERADLLNNLGNFLKAKGDLVGARVAFEKCSACNPNDPAPVYNTAVILDEEQAYEEAEAKYREAIRIDPTHVSAQWNLALVLIKLGKYLEGWKQFEWRWKWSGFTSPQRNFPQPQWAGEQLTGKTLLIHAEQGLGDSIQNLRYIEKIAAFGPEKIVVEVQPALKRLVASIKGIPADVVVTGEQLPWFDRHVPMMSLPGAFGTTVDTIPADIPYLASESEEVERWAKRMAEVAIPGKLKVGIVWAGNAQHTKDGFRSARLMDFAALAEMEGVQLFSLQKGIEKKQLEDAPFATNIVDWMDDIEDLAETLGLMANLDVVLSVDTSVAHLAGAAGIPLGILLANNNDYRWMLERVDTPWYPQARLFRQQRAGDWEGVIEQVKNALPELVGC